MRRDAGCTIVQPTRGDRQGAWGMGLPWQLEGAHMTSNTKVSRGGGQRKGAKREVSSAATAVVPPGERGAG